MERNGLLQCTFQHTELKPISQDGDVYATGVKSQLKLIPPWGCRQVCSSTSACAAEDGIAVTCPSWEGRHLLHLPASRTGCGSSPLPSTLLPLLQSSGQSHMGTLHHSWPLGYAKQVDFTWNSLGSTCMIPFPFSAKQHWAPTVTNSNTLSSTAAGQKNGYLWLKQALVHYLDKTEEFRHSSKWFIIVVTIRGMSLLFRIRPIKSDTLSSLQFSNFKA